jgi:short-subunit dehydrogenase
VDVVVADLTAGVDLRAVERRAAEESDLTLLVNNAGFGAYMPFAQLDADRAEALIALQVVAATRLTRAALPGMIARERGAIINVSSLLAFSASLPSPPLPRRATYVAAKAFLNAFTETLRGELDGTGVQVQALCPATVRTEFHAIQGIDPDRSPVAPMSPEDVVQASLAALKLGEIICAPGVEDPAIISAYQQARIEVFQSGLMNRLAPRYT